MEKLAVSRNTVYPYICWGVMDNLGDDKISRFSKNGKFIDFKVNFFSG